MENLKLTRLFRGLPLFDFILLKSFANISSTAVLKSTFLPFLYSLNKKSKMRSLKFTLLFSALVSLIIPHIVKAQEGFTCGSDKMHKELLEKHPEIRQNEEEMEAYTRDFIANYHPESGSRSSNPFIIPIVFHIINQANTENITDAQIYSEMKVMSDNWNKKNADTSVVINPFKSLIGDMGIEYRLANRDPNGNVCTGIDRIYSVQTWVGNDYSKLGNWPRDKYMNVWVVSRMQDGVAGYAYYPGSVDALYNTPARDGVILLQNYIGSIGTSSFANSRTLTHEIGHCFNLKHVWGDSNDPGVACGDDDVNDTPFTKGWNSCPTEAQSKICTPGIAENYQNFMEYSYCSHMFTIGQTARVAAALNSPKSDRNNLWTPANLIATGTDDTIYDKAPPIADFGVAITSNNPAGSRFVCTGDNAKFKCITDASEVDSYYWTFTNADITSSTLRDPIVKFSTPGYQTVTLTVTNSAGSSTKTRNNLVFVSYDNAQFQAPFTQGFEDPYVFSSLWGAANWDDNNTAFTRVNYGTHTGNGVAMLNNYYARNDHDIDEIVTPGFDLTTLSTSQMNLSFQYSWASASQYFQLHLADSMNVFASTDCGATWSNIYKKGTHSSSASLLGAGSVTGFYIPGSGQSYWKQVSIALAPVLKKPNVMFRFQVFSSVGGNNFYIDDINIGSAATAIEDLSSVTDLSIYPNPTHGDATLNLELAKSGNLSVKVYDIAGHEAMKVFEGWMNEGDTQLTIEGSSKLSAGVYIVNVKAGESVIQKKLVIQ